MPLRPGPWTVALAALAIAAVAGAAFPPDVADALETAKQIYVATVRKDGSQSSVVPVWFIVEDDAVLFTTAPGSHKVRRLRAGSPLLVWVGSREGPHFEGHAEVLADPDLAARMAPVYSAKYWLAWLGVARPNPERVRAGKTLIVRVRPS